MAEPLTKEERAGIMEGVTALKARYGHNTDAERCLLRYEATCRPGS